jgi:hypothetical protein
MKALLFSALAAPTLWAGEAWASPVAARDELVAAVVVVAADPKRAEVPPELAVRPGGPGLARPALESWAEQRRFHLAVRNRRAYLVDRTLSGADQGERLSAALLACASAMRQPDFSVSSRDPAVAPLVDQVRESYALSADKIGGRVAVGPVRRLWLTDGRDWVAVEAPPYFPEETLLSLRRHAPEGKPESTAGRPAPARPVPGMTAEILPFSQLCLAVSGAGANDPRQRMDDLKVGVEVLVAEFQQVADKVGTARFELDRASLVWVERATGQLPKVGDQVGALSPKWRAAADAAVDQSFKGRTLAERDAFLRHARVSQWSKNIEVAWMGQSGLEVRELRAP